MTYAADPGGNFASDVHRRVLAHLTTPKEKIGFTPEALLARLEPDQFTPVEDVKELTGVLGDLEADGYAVSHDGIWQQTKEGFEVLTGPISEEPQASPNGPAVIRADAPTEIP